MTHKLSDIILLTVCGVLSRQEAWEGIVDFGEMRRGFLNHYGDSSAGIPSADTVARVVGLLNPKEFQSAFIDWMKGCHELTKGEVVAVDGKTMRGSYNKAKGHQTIHMVNVFATANGVCLVQSKVNEKTNEITEIPKLLEMLDITGFLITIDAKGCQRKIAQKIVDKSADYLFAVKGNQGSLEQAFNDYYLPSMLSKFDADSYLNQNKSMVD
ncbi:ISAs1 family transposase ISPpr12 [Celerinatantimonas diazotrophica]|nr:ISAs1 family transposase ISPpr12 [Celerinatantimonas diazotrophica]